MGDISDNADTIDARLRTGTGTGTATGPATGSGSGAGTGAELGELEGGTDVKVGDVIGSFRIVELLGKGGMGRVYKAEHVRLGRTVAVKVLNRKYSTNREAVRRLFGEARAVNKIRHQNLIEITDFLEPAEGASCYVMELLQGETVREVLKRGPMAPERVADIGAQVASALAAVHTIHIVHRDLKPENIFLIQRAERADFVKLLDFGVAKLSPEVAGTSPDEVEAPSLLGTPAYMSPEQLSKGEVDGASDVYSLGVTMYEMVTGERPFREASFGALLIKHMMEPPPPIERPGVPQELADLIRACMAKQSADRPAPATLVARLSALRIAPEKAEPVEEPKARSRALPLLLAAGALSLVLGGLALRSRGDELQAAPAAPPPVPAPPKTVQLRFESNPPGAVVTMEGADAPLGTTPFARELPRADRNVAFSFALEGRPSARAAVTLEHDTTLSVTIPDAEKPSPAAPESSSGKARGKQGKRGSAEAIKDDTTILDPFGKP